MQTSPSLPGGVPDAVPGILLVAFGVTTHYGKPALGAFSEKVRAAFPGHAVRWAFTTRHKAKRPTLSGETGMDVAKALDAFAREGVARIAVQPLHIVDGREYAALRRRIETWQKSVPGVAVTMGGPLLASEAAGRDVLAALQKTAPPDITPDETVVWVGHGTRDAESCPYSRFASFALNQPRPLFLGCLLGHPDPEDLIAILRAKEVTRVCLMPFFALSGYHAARDMAGKGEASWRARLIRAGIACRAHLQGMVEYDVFAEMWLARLREALGRL